MKPVILNVLAAMACVCVSACGVEPTENAEGQAADLTFGGNAHGDSCSAPPPRDSRPLAVMTINLRRDADQMDRRLPILAKEIARRNPDLVGMQEVMIIFRQAERLVDLIVQEGGPRYELSQHHKPGVVGFLTGEGVAVLSRWPIVESRATDLGTMRTAQLARIALPSGGRIAMFNTHLENGQTPEKESIRRDEAERLTRFVDENAACEVSVLTGDFNSVPSSAAMQYVLERGFIDTHVAVPGSGDGNTFPVALADGAFDQHASMRIDFVMTRNAGERAAKPLDSMVCFTDPDAGGFHASDHFGVLATFAADL